jgi:hypothetical protein
MMTPFIVEFDQVVYMKFRPGIKMVLGPEIAVAVANCNKIWLTPVKKSVSVNYKMNNYPEVDVLLLGESR